MMSPYYLPGLFKVRQGQICQEGVLRCDEWRPSRDTIQLARTQKLYLYEKHLQGKGFRTSASFSLDSHTRIKSPTPPNTYPVFLPVQTQQGITHLDLFYWPCLLVCHHDATAAQEARPATLKHDKGKDVRNIWRESNGDILTGQGPLGIIDGGSLFMALRQSDCPVFCLVHMLTQYTL